MIVCIIAIMPRARAASAASPPANLARSSAAVGTWQKVQSFPIALANIPIASKNVSIGMSRSTVTLLNTSCVTMGDGRGVACADAGGQQAHHGDRRGPKEAMPHFLKNGFSWPPAWPY